MLTPYGRDFFTPGVEDDVRLQGECQRQEGWCPVAAQRQLLLENGGTPFSFHCRVGRRMRRNFILVILCV